MCAHVTGSCSLLGVGVRRIVGVAAADVLFFRVGLLVFFVVSAFFVFFLAAAPGSGFFLSFFSLCWPLTFVNPSVRNDDASSVPGCFSSTWSTSFFLSTNPLVRGHVLAPPDGAQVPLAQVGLGPWGCGRSRRTGGTSAIARARPRVRRRDLARYPVHSYLPPRPTRLLHGDVHPSRRCLLYVKAQAVGPHGDWPLGPRTGRLTAERNYRAHRRLLCSIPLSSTSRTYAPIGIVTESLRHPNTTGRSASLPARTGVGGIE